MERPTSSVNCLTCNLESGDSRPSRFADFSGSYRCIAHSRSHQTRSNQLVHNQRVITSLVIIPLEEKYKRKPLAIGDNSTWMAHILLFYPLNPEESHSLSGRLSITPYF